MSLALTTTHENDIFRGIAGLDHGVGHSASPDTITY